MKKLKLEKELSPKIKEGMVVVPGTYPVIEWRNDGFEFETSMGKIFVSHSEIVGFGKVIASVNIQKSQEKEKEK